jgi:transposase InsO family protein
MAALNYPSLRMLFHWDRGSNSTSSQFAVALKRRNIRQSVGRTGICYDKEMAGIILRDQILDRG